jgi:hypothetical protein
MIQEHVCSFAPGRGGGEVEPTILIVSVLPGLVLPMESGSKDQFKFPEMVESNLVGNKPWSFNKKRSIFGSRYNQIIFILYY